MDQITHTVRYSMWKDILFQCQNRPDGMSAKQWLKENQVSDITGNGNSEMNSSKNKASLYQRCNHPRIVQSYLLLK